MNGYVWGAKVVSICWFLFVIVWIVASFSTKRTIQHEGTFSRFGYLILVVLGYVLIVASRRLPYPLGLGGVPRPDWLAVLAAVICFAGLSFAIWARFTLGRNWSGLATLKEGHELIQRGPYRMVRHPIYTGLFMMVLATLLLRTGLGSIAGLLLVLLGFWLKILAEERLMRQRFPREYAAYEQRVKRLIPFLF